MKKLMFAFAASAAMATMAAMNDALLTFSTPGPDKYADGTTVLDGECYALVWTANGSTFAGLKADGTTIAETDKLVLIAPIAQNGACPELVFQVSAKEADAYANGTYAVYLLDTRVKGADGRVALAEIENGKPVAVNAQTAVAEAGAAKTGVQSALAVADAALVGGAVVKAETVIDQPKITGIKVEGAKIKVTVAGLSPVATYQVISGTKPGEIATKIDAEVKGDTFEFAKPEGSFFKVIGTRNF